MNWEIVIVLLITIILLAVILTLIYLSIPAIFRFVVAPHFDGSYNLYQDRVPKSVDIPEQASSPHIMMNAKSLTYQVNFGPGRDWNRGCVKIYCNGIWHSSHPIQEEHLLTFLGEETRSEDTMLGNATKRIWHWEIPDVKYKCDTAILEFQGKDYCIFEIYTPTGINGISCGDFGQPTVIFPAFENASYNQRIFTYRNDIFAPPQRDFTAVSAPVCLFDDSKNAVIICALDHFLTSIIRKIPTKSFPFMLECGVEGQITQLPPGYRQRFIAVFHRGINKSFQYWGDLLRQYYQTIPRDRYADIVLEKLGYWTDNGAYYYYNPIPGMKYGRTLSAIQEHADIIGVSFGYFQLDSWWYRKSVKKWKRALIGEFGRIIGGGLYGGTVRWEPDPETLALSVLDLSQKLGKPFIAHNRWFGRDSPYMTEFQFINEGKWAMPRDSKFWDYLMQNAKNWNILVYEQDWMKEQFEHFSFLRQEIGAAQEWLKQMADAATVHNRTIMYCLATPSMWLQAVEFPSVTSVRASGDYHNRWPHTYDIPYFTQASILTQAIGIWPFKDVFDSSRQGRIQGERCSELMAIISNLSGGPVGIGDRIGGINPDIIHSICRNDGLIYKPERPLTPVDLMFIRNCTYYVCTTESTHGKYHWHYVLTVNLWPSRVKTTEYTLADIDIMGDYVEYDWYSQEIHIISPNTPLEHHLRYEEFNYRIYAPLLLGNWAILGDPSKYVMMNDREFQFETISESGFKLHLPNIAGDRTELLIYTEIPPHQILVDGKIISEIPLPQMHQTLSTVPMGFIYNPKIHIIHLWINFHEPADHLLQVLR